MELNEVVQILEHHQRWRQGGEMEMTNPKDLGIAIDIVLKMVKIPIIEPIKNIPKNGVMAKQILFEKIGKMVEVSVGGYITIKTDLNYFTIIEAMEKFLEYNSQSPACNNGYTREQIESEINNHLNTLKYEGGYPADWRETLSNHLFNCFCPIPVKDESEEIKLLKKHKYNLQKMYDDAVEELYINNIRKRPITTEFKG